MDFGWSARAAGFVECVEETDVDEEADAPGVWKFAQGSRGGLQWSCCGTAAAGRKGAGLLSCGVGGTVTVLAGR